MNTLALATVGSMRMPALTVVRACSATCVTGIASHEVRARNAYVVDLVTKRMVQHD